MVVAFINAEFMLGAAVVISHPGARKSQLNHCLK
jgi:hypothetical protein